MKTAEIRRRFLAHFENAGHTVVPSAPSTERLHLEFAEPRPLSLTERMIGS